MDDLTGKAARRAGFPDSEGTDDVAQGLTAEASVLFTRGRFDEALAMCRQALAAYSGAGDAARACDVQVMMAANLTECDLHDAALACARQAFDRAVLHAQHDRVVRALVMVGALHGRMQDWDEGEQLLLQALSRARDRHDPAAVLSSLNALLALLINAQAHHAQRGDHELARSVSERLLRLAQRSLVHGDDERDSFRRTCLRSNVGAALLACGALEQAEPLLKDCIRQARIDGHRVLELKAHVRLCQTLLRRAATDEAELEIAQIQDKLRLEPHPMAQLEAWQLECELAELRGRPEAAAAQRAAVRADQRARDQRTRDMRQALDANLTQVHAQLGVSDAQ